MAYHLSELGLGLLESVGDIMGRIYMRCWMAYMIKEGKLSIFREVSFLQKKHLKWSVICKL